MSKYFGNNIGIYQLKLLLILFVAIFLAGFLVCFDCTGRFEPAHFLVFSILFALIYFNDIEKRKIISFLYIILFIVLMGLVFVSGERTTFVLAMLLILFYFFIKNKVVFLFVLFSCLMLLLLINVEALDLRRFESLFSEEGDQSIKSRLNEIYDVLHHFTINATFFNYIFGFGFSATYQPVNFSGIDLNVSDSGTVHHVHVFPFLVLLRFGLLGVGIYLYLWWRVLKDVLFFSFKNRTKYNPIYVFSLLSTFLFLLESLMRSVFVDPFFYIVLSMYLFFLTNSQLKINR